MIIFETAYIQNDITYLFGFILRYKDSIQDHISKVYQYQLNNILLQAINAAQRTSNGQLPIIAQ